MEILAKIYEKIVEYDTIIIHGHKRPDGDCYGSQFGLKNIIESTFKNKKVYVVGEHSNYVSFLGKMDIIEDSLYDKALCIVVDTATESRISDSRYKLGKELIKIDHHIPIDQYGDYIWVDPSFPSCGQMIAYFFKKYEDKLKLNKDGATALYTGIVTDTNRFKYRGVSRLTHELAGMLISYGVDIEEVDWQLSKESLEKFKFKAYILSKINFDKGFLYTIITQDDINKFEISDEEAASVVNLLGSIINYHVWFIAIEYKSEVRIRIRSNKYEIDRFANMYRGGGHKLAAGATLTSLEELPKFLSDLRKYLKGENKE